MKKSFSLGHEITQGSYNLYSAFRYTLNSPVPVAVSLKGKQTRKENDSNLNLGVALHCDSVTRYTNVRQQHFIFNLKITMTASS